MSVDKKAMVLEAINFLPLLFKIAVCKSAPTTILCREQRVIAGKVYYFYTSKPKTLTL